MAPVIGLFGGTFDPIHDGHIHLAKELLRKYPFKKLLFIPNAQNPLKPESARASGALRLQMIEAALKAAGESKFEVSRIEIDRPAPSYMIDTIELLQKQYDDPLVLILGNEVFQSLHQWKDVKRLLETVSVIVVKRDPDYVSSVDELLKKLHIFTRSNNFPWIKEFAADVLDLSSTEVRKTLEEAWKKEHLPTSVQGIQESVWQLIKVNHLYAR